MSSGKRFLLQAALCVLTGVVVGLLGGNEWLAALSGLAVVAVTSR